MPCKNPSIPLANSKNNIEEKITKAFEGFELPVNQLDWDNINKGLNSNGEDEDFESRVQNSFQNFELPITENENIWANINNAVNTSTSGPVENIVSTTFNNFTKSVGLKDWISIKLGLWFGAYRNLIVPTVLLAGFITLALLTDTKEKETSVINSKSETNNTTAVLPNSEAKITAPKVEELNKNSTAQTETAEAELIKGESNLVNTNSQSPKKSGIKVEPNYQFEGNNELNSSNAVPNKNLEVKKESNNTNIGNTDANNTLTSPEIAPIKYTTFLNFSSNLLKFPQLGTLNKLNNSASNFELIKPKLKIPKFNYFVDAGITVGNITTPKNSENSTMRDVTLNTKDNSLQTQFKFGIGYQFKLNNFQLKTGLGLDINVNGLNSEASPYMGYWILRPKSFFPHIKVDKDTIWVARKWDSVYVEIQQAPKTSWFELPIQLQTNLYKNKRTSIFAGINATPGILISSSGYVANPYTRQISSYWQYFNKLENVNTYSTTSLASDYLKKWRIGTGVNLGIHKEGYFGWYEISAGYQKNGNIWKTNDVLLLRQRNNQYNVKLTMGLKF